MRKTTLLWAILILCPFFTYAQTQSGLIDFEQGNYNGTHNPADNTTINNLYFSTAYGITFSCVDQFGNSNYLPRYAKVGLPMTAFSVSSSITPYSTTKGTGGCSGNTDAFDHPVGTPQDEGCWFLTDDDGIVTQNPKTLRIDYDLDIQRCNEASGVLIDVDGNEAFHIRAYTNGNFSTPESEILLVAPNYMGPPLPPGVAVFSNINYPTGDAKSAYWALSTSNYIERIEIDYVGSVTSSVGIAFDEFSYCARDYSLECPISPNIILNNPNDGSGKIRLTDVSTVDPNSTIVSRTWTVETINTDRQYYSGGKIFDFIVPTSDNYLVCLEVTAINNTTGECCTKRICEWFYVEVEGLGCSLEPSFNYSCFSNDCLFQFKPNTSNANKNIRGWYWTFGDGESSFDQKPIHAYSSPGVYEVCLTVTGELYEETTAEGACCTETYCETIDFSTCQGVVPPVDCDFSSGGGDLPAPRKLDEGEDEKQKVDKAYKSTLPKSSFIDKLSVVPNPAANEAELFFMVLQDEQMVSVELVDALGKTQQQLLNKQTMNAGKQTVKMNIAGFESGTYFIRVSAGNDVKTTNLVVLH